MIVFLFQYITSILVMVIYIIFSYLIAISSSFITNCTLCFSWLVYTLLLPNLVLILLLDYSFFALLFDYLHLISILSLFPSFCLLVRADSFHLHQTWWHPIFLWNTDSILILHRSCLNCSEPHPSLLKSEMIILFSNIVDGGKSYPSNKNIGLRFFTLG